MPPLSDANWINDRVDDFCGLTGQPIQSDKSVYLDEKTPVLSHDYLVPLPNDKHMVFEIVVGTLDIEGCPNYKDVSPLIMDGSNGPDGPCKTNLDRVTNECNVGQPKGGGCLHVHCHSYCWWVIQADDKAKVDQTKYQTPPPD